ncbi:hypothetical protein, conserved, DUF835 family (C-terminus) [Thermococcus kodakarensis KOD1]|uniref:DUF835 domain-containing protein n=1 Tax=Thermococcus kodakarensis (strain ATCC BAA-918 / JCM 12380 / KOD1) TaxID=69014 RepID=Q5JD04_THEKO|nr:DUF835 domain-containing protein [Thermococcus kodakarensis]WCN28446.1 DUF835 domain-containing protein [Thermococcus kodakarensis]WCN30742.1 DUF835 domain-containing protein [Thermococcus kodakarensis]BAD84566.1 hypothetical protein, conserved, DUF835 family (C-terminus) [Thermococcus kodakarensis KOD1]
MFSVFKHRALLSNEDASSPGEKYHFRIVQSIRDIPEKRAVVIGRAGTEVPRRWKLIPVSSVKGYFGPRELHRILEGIVEHLKHNPDVPVIIDCLEYLTVYNGFESVLKFLHLVRDYAILTSGRVYLVTDPMAWDPKQMALLRGLEA